MAQKIGKHSHALCCANFTFQYHKFQNLSGFIKAYHQNKEA